MTTCYLKDYSPPDYLIPTIDLTVEIDPQDTKVYARHHFKRNQEKVNSAELFLNGEDLELQTIKIDGQDLDPQQYRVTSEGLTLSHPPQDFILETEVVVHPDTNTRLEGIYLSGNILCTQCEAEGFRRITYTLDRPDILSIFTVTLIADPHLYPILLSNGNHSRELSGKEGDKIREVFIDPFPKPSYLFAMVAGKMDVLRDIHTTPSGRDIHLAIYAEPGKIDKCVFAMEALKAAMLWDEKVYKLEYDLDDYKIVAVDSFNMGAMENKGLNIFNSVLIFYNEVTATDLDLERVASTIAHEYFHNWTGNRVTLRDWFQLTLKEGLTVYRDRCFSATHFSPVVERIRNTIRLRSQQFPEDNGPLSHPIQPDTYQSINNFYTTTIYEKGAEVVGMYETILGKNKFIQGVRQYLHYFDGKATTVEDFFLSMQALSLDDLSQFQRWYHTPGTPVIQVETEYEETEQVFRVRLRQSLPAVPDAQPLLIPLYFSVNLERQGRIASPHRGLWLLKEAEETRTFPHIEVAPRLSLNENFSAPVKVVRNFNYSDWIDQFRHEPNSFLKWDTLQECYLRLYLDKMADPQLNLLKPVRELVEAMKPAWEPIRKAFHDFQGIPHDKKSALYFLEYGKNDHRHYGDCSFLTQLLTFPSFAELMESVAVIDFESTRAFTEEFKKLFITETWDWWENIYTTLHQIHVFLMEQGENMEASLIRESTQGIRNPVGERELKNRCLHLLLARKDKPQIDRAIEQLRVAQKFHNFNDEFFGFKAVLLQPGPESDKASEDFYQRWRKDNLVINRWLESIAQIEDEVTLKRIRELQTLPEFNLHEPNKCRSLFRTFIRNNPVIFNHPTGEGYRLITEVIIQLDTINPQSAADLLVSWPALKKLGNPQRPLMLRELQRIKKNSTSKDVLELVEKRLSQA